MKWYSSLLIILAKEIKQTSHIAHIQACTMLSQYGDTYLIYSTFVGLLVAVCR